MKLMRTWDALGALASILILGTVLSPAVYGQEQDAEIATPERFTSPDVAGVEALVLADEMIDYGIRMNSPEVLVAAAKILVDNPTSDDEIDVEEESELAGPDAAPQEKQADDGPRLDANEVLAMAAEMAGENRALQDMIEEVRAAPRARGAVGGPVYGVFRVRAGSYLTHPIRFEGNRQALVAVKGDGDTDLDCIVFNSAGRRVLTDMRNSDICALRFWPSRTETYRIRVVNWGRVWNRYEVLTN